MSQIDTFAELKQILESRRERSQVDFVSNKLAIFQSIEVGKIDTNVTRVNMMTFAFCTAGRCVVSLDLRHYNCRPGSLFTLAPNQFFQISRVSPDCRGHVFFVAPKILEEELVKLRDMADLFLYVRSHPFVQLAPAESDTMIMYAQLAFGKIGDQKHFFYNDVLRHLLLTIFYEVCNLYSRNILQNGKSLSRQEILMQQFFLEVTRHFKEQRHVKYYADLLAVNAKYLSEVCRQVTGQLAPQWIDDYVVTEAKVLLSTTRMSIKEIAVELNFPDQSVFGKYFKRIVGMTPKEYVRSSRHSHTE